MLANTLFKSIPTKYASIFVGGDKDQLPSVGPGQVLHDLLEIEQIPKQELTEIYRQRRWVKHHSIGSCDKKWATALQTLPKIKEIALSLLVMLTKLNR